MVSIVVPVYNVKSYLRECIDSILAQTYKEFELILVDDGSVDASGRICDEYGIIPCVRVIHKKNEGLGMARNSGMEIARGDYVAFLDSDDYWKPDALEGLMSGIAKYGADTCLGGYLRISDQGKRLFEEKPQERVFRTPDEVKTEFFPRLLGSAPAKKDAFRPSVWNGIYSMNIIRKYGIRFPSEREYLSEDVMFNIDYYQYSQCVYITGNAEYFYRETPGSLTGQYKEERFEKYVFLYKEVLKRLADTEYGNDCALRAKRQFFVCARKCIRQECMRNSKMERELSVENIKRICENEFIRECIDTYPCKKLGVRQRLFLLLVRYKGADLLWLLFFRRFHLKGLR